MLLKKGSDEEFQAEVLETLTLKLISPQRTLTVQTSSTGKILLVNISFLVSVSISFKKFQKGRVTAWSWITNSVINSVSFHRIHIFDTTVLSKCQNTKQMKRRTDTGICIHNPLLFDSGSSKIDLWNQLRLNLMFGNVKTKSLAFESLISCLILLFLSFSNIWRTVWIISCSHSRAAEPHTPPGGPPVVDKKVSKTLELFALDQREQQQQKCSENLQSHPPWVWGRSQSQPGGCGHSYPAECCQA